MQQAILTLLKENMKELYIKKYWESGGNISEDDRINLVKECSQTFFDVAEYTKKNRLIKDVKTDTDRLIDVYKTIMNNYIDWEKEFNNELKKGGIVKK